MGTQQQQMEVQDQEPKLISKISKSFNCLIPMLIGVLRVNTQGSMPLAALISGSLSSVVLLPRWLGLVIFIAWAVVTINVAYQVHAVLIHNACQRLNQMIMDIISKLSSTCDICKWFTWSPSIEQEPLLV
ncbi:hypothetical protein Dsin_026395 [Dipteronia sinensis]|uniref:Uncharacterized protein n=1 Tax=Dipteronia sinensis TaxID=43782 RepID=A0AAD9ZXV8_9ROSI|nr:hypothetical protein Dsin_026395 [Dipteronia sinensis]